MLTDYQYRTLRRLAAPDPGGAVLHAERLAVAAALEELDRLRAAGDALAGTIREFLARRDELDLARWAGRALTDVNCWAAARGGAPGAETGPEGPSSEPPP